MPEGEKPYRLYRGGRAKGSVPLRRHEARPPGRGERAPKGPARGPRRRRRWGRIALLGLLVLVAALAAWLVASYFAFAGAIGAANDRIPEGVRTQLAAQDGLLLSSPTTVLIIGTDGGAQQGRDGARRADSIMLLRTDPGRDRIAYLSIPRDLRVDIPGYGAGKVNAAFQVGGPALALRTVKGLTGLEVHHVAFVDFDGFRELIDAVGGIEVRIPKPILSNRFDCPFASERRCADWEGWRFERGNQHLDGRRALVYSRVRENRLNPSETDFTRGRRQQQVIAATADKVTSLGTALKLPFVGDSLVRPLSTDLSAGQLLQLAWVWFRADAGSALHCRLGGESSTVNGESVILGSEDNVAAVAMFIGRSAPLAPPRGLAYAPGCVVGE